METCSGNVSYEWALPNTQHRAAHGTGKMGLEWTVTSSAFTPSIQMASGEKRRICASKTEAPAGEESHATTLPEEPQPGRSFWELALVGFTQTWLFCQMCAGPGGWSRRGPLAVQCHV